jgi:16S rRNA (adenine1518-N6/adenine1519-N6)-dimethyltransferase
MKTKGARLGQHFLIHSWAARSLAHAAALKVGETFVEVGPGKGVLTKELLMLAPVIAIEKDEALAGRLRESFRDEIASGRLRLIEGDVRDFDPASIAAPYVVAANIPYYITGEIIRQFLTASAQPRAMALLVQKEVAQRIVSAKESILSLSVKAYGMPRLVEKVSRTHFSPPPSVDSAILAIHDISKRFFDTVSEDAFFRVVHAGFASKRKYLSNNLARDFEKEAIAQAFAAIGIPEKARAEDIALAQWKRLAEELH